MPKLGDIIQGNKRQNYYKDSNKYIWSSCVDCGKERWVMLDKNGRPKYNKCGSCSKSGRNNPRWEDGRSEGIKYVLVWQPEKKCHIGKHRLIMEEHLGRKLTSDEIVHHINGNRSDNRIENLILFKNDNEHASWHYENGDFTGLHRVHKETSDRKEYQAQYYKNNLKRLKKYKKLKYEENLKKEET